MKKNNNLNFKQTHGALNGPSVDELFGIKKNPYKEKRLEDYAEKIECMTSQELYAHSIEVGVVPIELRGLLLDRLKKQYNIVNAGPAPVFKTGASKKDLKERERLIKQMSP